MACTFVNWERLAEPVVKRAPVANITTAVMIVWLAISFGRQRAIGVLIILDFLWYILANT